MSTLKIIITYICFISSLSFGELINLEIGAKIEIYGEYYRNWLEPKDVNRIPEYALSGRSIGPNSTHSPIRTGKESTSTSFVEQRTRLHIKSTISNNIFAFFEFDSRNYWGEDFRAQDYLTGKDTKTYSSDNIDVFQAYIQSKDFLTIPGLTLTLGRQAIDFGSGWLVGSDPGPNPFAGVSFDAIRLNFNNETLSLDLFYSKLAENFAGLAQNDIDFGGVYLTIGSTPEKNTLDLYYFILRDDTNVESTNGDIIFESIEDILGRDKVQTTYIHTVGIRLFGKRGNLDYETELAYQLGNSDHLGLLFKPIDGIYGDSDAKWNLPAGHLEIGYTLSNLKSTPRVYIGGRYYGGKDNRSISLTHWIFGFGEGRASTSFNRLFTSYREDSFIDVSGMSNFWKIYSGFTITPIDPLNIGLDISHYEAVDPFDAPISISLHRVKIFPFGTMSFITEQNPKDIGWQLLIFANYAFTEELEIEIGWSHFFIGEGLAKGLFIDNYGTQFLATESRDGSNFFYWYINMEF